MGKSFRMIKSINSIEGMRCKKFVWAMMIKTDGGGRKEVSDEYWWTELHRKIKLSSRHKIRIIFLLESNGNFAQLNPSRASLQYKMRSNMIRKSIFSFKELFTLDDDFYGNLFVNYLNLPSLSITLKVRFSQAAYKLSWSRIFMKIFAHRKALDYTSLTHKSKVHTSESF